jgi:hypothetical protein
MEEAAMEARFAIAIERGLTAPVVPQNLIRGRSLRPDVTVANNIFPKRRQRERDPRRRPMLQAARCPSSKPRPCDAAYVSRVIRFAFLAPNIVEQIAGDHQPPDFTAESLLRSQAELPVPT